MMGSAQASGSVVALQRYPVGEALNAVEVRHPDLGLGIAPSPSGRRSRTQTCRADAPYLD